MIALLLLLLYYNTHPKQLGIGKFYEVGRSRIRERNLEFQAGTQCSLRKKDTLLTLLNGYNLIKTVCIALLCRSVLLTVSIY